MDTITIEGITFPIKPTPLPKLAKARALFAQGPESEEGSQAVIEAIFWGIRRAGGEVTLEWLQMNVDGLNAAYVMEVFAKVNTLQTPGSESSGEAKAGG